LGTFPLKLLGNQPANNIRLRWTSSHAELHVKLAAQGLAVGLWDCLALKQNFGKFGRYVAKLEAQFIQAAGKAGLDVIDC